MCRHRVRDSGQITLPADARRRPDLKPGDYIAVKEREQGITPTPCNAAEQKYTVPDVPRDIPEPTPEQLARRELIDRILENRKRRNISPLIASDLIRLSRDGDF